MNSCLSKFTLDETTQRRLWVGMVQRFITRHSGVIQELCEVSQGTLFDKEMK